MSQYNPHIAGQYNPLYTLNNQGFFIAHNMIFCTNFLYMFWVIPHPSTSGKLSFWESATSNVIILVVAVIGTGPHPKYIYVYFQYTTHTYLISYIHVHIFVFFYLCLGLGVWYFQRLVFFMVGLVEDFFWEDIDLLLHFFVTNTLRIRRVWKPGKTKQVGHFHISTILFQN